MQSHIKRFAASMMVLSLAAGCKTADNIIDTTRSAAQELLLNNALEGALCDIDFRYFSGQSVYYDDSHVDGLDKGWINFRIRESLLLVGAQLKEDREKADVILEAAVGTYGTSSRDRSCGVYNGYSIPDVTMSRHDVQYGSTILSLLATDRKTGQLTWRSGPVRCDSYLSSRYLFGCGPFYEGTIRHPAETFEPYRTQSNLLPGKVKLGIHSR